MTIRIRPSSDDKATASVAPPRRPPASPSDPSPGQMNLWHDAVATPLHAAAASGDARRVARLLAAGAESQARDRRGRTPLHRAAAATPHPFVESHAQVIHLLLRAGGPDDVNAEDASGSTALHLAARHGATAVVAQMSDEQHGWADRTCVDTFGRTALHEAAAGGHVACATLLLRPSTLPDYMPRSEAAHVEAADMLGRTPLHIAVERRDPQMVWFLLSRDARVERADHAGTTPLALAVQRGDACIALMLAERAASAASLGWFAKLRRHLG